MQLKINDIDKYNKKLLAIIGTLIILGLSIALLTGLIGFISFQFRKKTHHRQAKNNGVVVNANQLIDTTTHALTQEISILSPYQLDTINPVFIVPIGQKDQKTKRFEVLQGGLEFHTESYSDHYSYESFSGLYNNFVLIDYVRNIKKELFDRKVAITDWAYLKINTNRLVVFKGTDADSNNDGRLNDDDFQNLYVYDIDRLKIKTLKFEHQTVLDFSPLKKTTMLYVKTGKDLNKDNNFEFYNEPTDLYFYDLTTGEFETLIPIEIAKRINSILNN